MKVFIGLMLLLSVSFSYTHAGDEYYEKNSSPKKMEEREVIAYDFDLELELENGVVEAEWDDFEEQGFEWYKLVYSTTNSKPVYPVDKTVFVGSKDQTDASFKLKRGYENHYIRICAITLNDDYSKDRYCGAVQTLEWDGEYKEYEEKKEYKKDYKKVEKKEIVKQKAKVTELSSGMKDRVDDIIEGFIARMENNDFSDEKIVSTIDIILIKLKKYERQPKYKALASYMREVLQEYKDKYDNPFEDLEKIFNEF